MADDDKSADDELEDFLSLLDPQEKKEEPKSSGFHINIDAGDSIEEFMESTGIKRERNVPDITKPWMKYHKFVLVKTMDEANEIIDKCIERGFCALDLETEGLDNRIDYKNGKPETKHKIVGFCLCYDGETGYYLPIRHRPTDGGPNLNLPTVELEAAITRLCQATIPVADSEVIQKEPLSYKGKAKLVIAFWHAHFDQEFLYPVTGIDWWHPDSFEDGMLAAYVKFAGDKRLGLKVKASELLKDPDGNDYAMIEIKELFSSKKKIRFQTLSPDEPGVIKYACSDAICTYKLCTIPELVPLCHTKHEFTYRIEKQVVNVIRVMERNRVKINRQIAKAMLDEQTIERSALLNRIQKFAKDQKQWINLDPNSPKQLSEFLFGPTSKGMDITPKPEKNEASGQYKTDAESLENLAKLPNAPPILKDIVRFREVEKFISTYLLGFANNPDENDELRFNFKQTGAATGRFSAPAGDAEQGYSGIPIHGIPNDSTIRKSIIAREDYVLIKADYAGEELRIAANVSGEPVWINEFLHGSGDLHAITAKAFFNKRDVTKEERAQGKAANFALLYGGGPPALMRATGCDKMEATRRKKAFDKSVPSYADWIHKQHKKVKVDLGISTAFNRWLPIPDANHVENAIRTACERHSTNYSIQGAGADIMKIAMIFLHRKFMRQGWLGQGSDDSVRMLLTVHDEIVFEIRYNRVVDAMPIIVELMESPWRIPKNPSWKVPLVVEPLVGFNWDTGYKVKRVPQSYTPKKDEFVVNGFVYHTTRERNKDTDTPGPFEIAEEKLFRVVDPPWLKGKVNLPDPDPPWLMGKVRLQAINEAVPESIIEAKEEESAKVEAPVAKALVIEEPVKIGTPILTWAEEKVESPTEVLVLRINQLNECTVGQVTSFVKIAADNVGPILHLTDIVGETLIPPSLNIRIKKDALIALLRYHNLLQMD